MSNQQTPSQNTQQQAPKPRRPHGHGHGPGAMMRPAEKAKDFKGTIRKLLTFMAQFKLPLLFVIIFALASTVFSIIGPKVMSTATTELFNGIVAKIDGSGAIDFTRIAQILLFTLALYVFSAACSFGQGWLMSSISQKTCFKLRELIAQKIDRLPMGYFESSSTGDTLSRITNDVDTLGQSLNQGITQLITSTVTLIGVTAMMFYINWVMALVALLILPISALFISIVVKHSQKYFIRQQNTLGAINGLVEETFSGHAIVKAFNQEDRTVVRFNETNRILREAAWKSQFLSGLMQPIMNFISNLGYVVVAILGSFFAIQGIITVGDIQAFIQYVKNFTQPITQLAQVSNVLQSMVAAAERIFDFLDEPEVATAPSDIQVKDVKSRFEFQHVWFGYDPEKPIIKDFTAQVNPGQTVALVGPTGAGKTTIIKLLMRFYDVNQGAIQLDGHNIKDFERNNLRSLFAIVLQDTWLFNGTIRENIRYGRLDATDEDVEKAAKAAYIHHFICTLPDGYDTVINEDATNISSGQRQLITIARAFLADRRVLILDEATSSVDTRTEERIQKAMDNLMSQRTSFVIAHRLSTIRSADLILVIRDGDIVEQGTHEELITRNGFYAELYNAQFESSEFEAGE